MSSDETSAVGPGRAADAIQPAPPSNNSPEKTSRSATVSTPEAIKPTPPCPRFMSTTAAIPPGDSTPRRPTPSPPLPPLPKSPSLSQVKVRIPRHKRIARAAARRAASLRPAPPKPQPKFVKRIRNRPEMPQPKLPVYKKRSATSRYREEDESASIKRPYAFAYSRVGATKSKTGPNKALPKIASTSQLNLAEEKDKPLPPPPAPENDGRSPFSKGLARPRSSVSIASAVAVKIPSSTPEVKEKVIGSSRSKIPYSVGSHNKTQHPKALEQFNTPTRVGPGSSRLPVAKPATSASRPASRQSQVTSPPPFNTPTNIPQRFPITPSPLAHPQSPTHSTIPVRQSGSVRVKPVAGIPSASKNRISNSNPFGDRGRAISSPTTMDPTRQSVEGASPSRPFDGVHVEKDASSPEKLDGMSEHVNVTTVDNKESANAQSDHHGDIDNNASNEAHAHASTPILGESGVSAIDPKASTSSQTKRSSIPRPGPIMHTNDDTVDDMSTNTSLATDVEPPFDFVDSNNTIYEDYEIDPLAYVQSPEQEDASTAELNAAEDTTEIVAERIHLDNNGNKKEGIILPDGYRLKQLSKKNPAMGPQLRIAPDADKILLGLGDSSDDDEKPAELKPDKNRSRKSGGRIDFRLSTDSFFGKAQKHVVSSQSTAALMTSPSKDASNPNEDKKVKKTKSTEVRRASTEPRNQTSQGPIPRTDDIRRTGTNPFFLDEPAVPRIPEGFGAGYSNNGDNISATFSPAKDNARSQPTNTKDIESPYGKDNSGRKHISQMTASSKASSDATVKRRGTVSSKHEFDRMQLERSNAFAQESSSNAFRQPSKAKATTSDLKLDKMVTENGNDFTAKEDAEVSKKEATTTAQREPPTSVHRRLAAHGLGSAKASGTRGVLSNFRGFFTKQKADIAKGTPSKRSPIPKIGGPVKPIKVGNGATSSTGSPVVRTRSRRQPISSPRANGDNQVQRKRATDQGSELNTAPRLADNAFDVSSLTMEILESARCEEDTPKKEKLIRLGKILIEAVNHSHDAEKAMLKAVQAAKEAEVACALAKENAMKMGLIAREWATAEGYLGSAV